MKLLDQLASHATLRGDAIAYQEAGGGRRLTYRELHERVIADSRSISPGEVRLIVAPNRIETPIEILATWAAGATALVISADSTESERTAALAPSPGIPGEGRGEGDFDRGMAPLFARNDPHPPVPEMIEDRAREPEEECLRLQSSGTTGRPQIVCRSAESVDAVCDQMARALAITPDDRVLAVTPLSHSYGIEHGLLMPIFAGATVHLCPGFDLPLVLRELTEAQITFLPGVPAMYEMLTRLAEPGTRWPHLRRAYSAGATLPAAVFDRACQQFDVVIEQLYGATEIGSVTFGDRHAAGFDPRSVGMPMEAVEAIVIGLEDERPLPAGNEGQLCIRARSMFSGYVDRTVRPKMIDGYFATGDIASMDASGQITVTGRLSLLIDVGGLKVNPIEVEETIARHEQVASCVVLPVRQSETVCRIKAVVTPTDPLHPPTIESLRQFAREHLSAHKLPRTFDVRNTLPRTATGKILRHQIETSRVDA